MKKIYIALILFVLMFFSNSVVIKAEGEFNTDFNVNYKVIDNGITSVSNQITLTWWYDGHRKCRDHEKNKNCLSITSTAKNLP